MISHSTVRIGIDVGGTNTDAVVLDTALHATPTRGVLASHKVPTTRDTAEGIRKALAAVLEKVAKPLPHISSVTIGTTAFLNSVIQRDAQSLSRVAVIRLSKSFLRDVPPFSGWPKDLAAVIHGYVGYVDGGLNIDGSEEAPVVPEQVAEQCEKIQSLGIKSIVVAGVYSPIDVDHHQEDTVRQLILQHLPQAQVVCSHEVANIGFLERENAAILNAAIVRYARRTIRAFHRAIDELGLRPCPLYLTQNDGTLLDASVAASLPIRTFASGVTNSMRGAAYLSGHGMGDEAAVVVDIGGTTTDVGVLLPSGLPRQASAYVSVAGIKVNYSMPHVHSIGLGGGSIITQGEQPNAKIGPESVGHELHRSLVFGGDTCTAMDISVASGQAARIGNPELVKGLDPPLVEASRASIQDLLEKAIDAVKTSPEPIRVFMTGGGSVIAPDAINGVSEVIKPPFHDVCNAVGAACSKVGATLDSIQSTADKSQLEIGEDAKVIAINRAVEAGAVRETVVITKIDMILIPYLENQIRVIVGAMGDLDLDRVQGQETANPSIWEIFDDEDASQQQALPAAVQHNLVEGTIDHHSYRPQITLNQVTNRKEWIISLTDLDYLADGCYVLGCAGGGNPEAGKMQLKNMVEAGHTIRVIDPSSIDASATVYWGGRMGTPAAIAERLQAHETVDAMRALMDHLSQESFDAVMGLEIGGSNGLEALLCGSSRFFDRPVLDADFMGRANPMCWQLTLTVHRPGEFVPCAIDSGDGQTVLMTRAKSDESVDKPLRGALVEMGSLVGLAGKPTTAGIVRQCAVRNTVSLAWRIGRAIALAEADVSISQTADRIISEVGGPESAKVLFRGKITAVERTLHKGHSVGVLHIAHAPIDEGIKSGATRDVAIGGTLRIPFINENILAEHHDDNGTVKVLATVPDLIALLDSQTGRAVGVPEYKYGCHVTVLAIPCSPRWTETPRGLEIGGPQGYGYDLPYKPIGKYVEPRSVIEEFGS
ncbi:hypothetical protein CC79DRAFT_1386028 [Sarocladium strictum]